MLSERLLNADEAADLIGISRNQLYILCRAEKVPHVRLPADNLTDRRGRRRLGALRFDRRELLGWLEQYRRGPRIPVAS